MLSVKQGKCILAVTTLMTALAAFVSTAAAYAADMPNLRGQWIGNSLLDGQREKAKTSLSLGAPDDAENATMRIEDRSACTLLQGKYSVQAGADGAPAWSLSFKEGRGGEVCERLAQGIFLLRPGAGSRKLEFDVTYSARDGAQNHRVGVLNRYP